MLVHALYALFLSVRPLKCAIDTFTDYSKGFGGKFGVQEDRVDKSAVGWDYKSQLSQHESQKGTNVFALRSLWRYRFQNLIVHCLVTEPNVC